MDPAKMDLISPTSYQKTRMNNQPQTPHFEPHNIINHPQDQGEIKKKGPSVVQLFESGNKKTSFKPKAQRSTSEILVFFLIFNKRPGNQFFGSTFS